MCTLEEFERKTSCDLCLCISSVGQTSKTRAWCQRIRYKMVVFLLDNCRPKTCFYVARVVGASCLFLLVRFVPLLCFFLFFCRLPYLLVLSMATNSYRVAHANATTENLGKQSSSVHQNDVARDAAMEFTLYSVVPGTLKAAIELGVFEILAKAGAAASQKSLTTKEIAEQLVRPTANGTAVNSGYLQRILRLLASVNIVSESVAVVAAAEPGNFTSYNTHHQRSYALTPIGKYFVQGEDGSSLAPFFFMHDDWVFKKSFDHLSAAVLDDSVDPFVRAHGKSVYQLNNDDPRVDKLFNTAMTSHSSIYMEALLGAYHGFQDVNCLVDVGGCTGASLALITAKYPHIRGINFDLPHVVATSPTYPSTLFIPTFLL